MEPVELKNKVLDLYQRPTQTYTQPTSFPPSSLRFPANRRRSKKPERYESSRLLR